MPNFMNFISYENIYLFMKELIPNIIVLISKIIKPKKPRPIVNESKE